MNFIIFVEENYLELCKLIVGKTHQAFGLLCTRIQDYPVNSVDLSQNCRAYLQKNLLSSKGVNYVMSNNVGRGKDMTGTKIGRLTVDHMDHREMNSSGR